MKNIFILFLFLPSIIIAQIKRPINIDDLWAMQRIGLFDVSPDEKLITFTVTSYSLELNKGNTDIYLIDSDGKNQRTLKATEKNETEPQFTPGGAKISYLYDGQIWTCSLDGSNEEQLSDIYTKVTAYKWSNDGKKILFTSSVYPECMDQECNKKRDEEKEASKVKASIFTELMFRHWDKWRGDKRSHLFIFDVESKKYIDLNLKSKFDVPPIALGSDNDFNFSPDGKEAVYTMNVSDMLATSTNNDIFRVDLNSIKEGYETAAEKISKSQGNDNQPLFSPDGKYIAFCSMKRAGFEADKQDLILYDKTSGDLRNLTEGFNRSVDKFVWSPDSRNIYFNAENEIHKSIYNLDVESKNITLLIKDHVNDNPKIFADGKKIFFKQQSAVMPDEIFAMDNDGKNIRQITYLNKERLAQIGMNPVETFWTEGAEGTKVESILLKPPFFDSSKKYPMIFLIHGGPQGHWTDEFHYRWNLQMFASGGYIVVAPNPRGSTGYGQKFTDEISLDWGGKVYIDLMNVYDYSLKTFDYIDKNNTFAAGASYGGYIINWIEGHTDRFNALVCHDGVFNLESDYGTTEELWFPEWEYGGPPWENREMYEKWSPHLYIQNAKTPMLIIHGANDFRVAEEQAFQLFTSLQRLGVESKFLYFPDETHWVTKPQNSRLWWKTIFEWFNTHKKMEIQ